MKVSQTVRTKGAGTLRRRYRRRHHLVGEGGKTVVKFQFVDPADDLTCEGGLAAWKRSNVLAREAFGDG